MCWASGPPGMSDGVMTPRRSIEHLVECGALLAQGMSENTVKTQYVETTRRAYSKTSVLELGQELDVIKHVEEEHRVSVVVLQLYVW